MTRVDTKNGFSLVELMVAALATSILALTFGSTLYFVFNGWQHNMAAVELQNSAYFAMRTIAKEVRLASSKDMAVTAQSLTLGAASPVFSVNTDRDFLFHDRILISRNVLNSTDIFKKYPDDGTPIQGVTVTLDLTDDEAGHSCKTQFTVSARNM